MLFQTPLLDSALQHARQSHAESDYEQSISSCCHAIEGLLGQRCEAMVSDTLVALPLPAREWVFVRRETSLKLNLNGDSRHGGSGGNHRCPEETSRLLLAYAEKLVLHLPRRGLREALDVALRQCLEGISGGPASLHRKKRLLWFFSCLHGWLLRVGRTARPHGNTHETLLACVLHEPESRIRATLEAHRFWNFYNYAKRLIHLENRRGSDSYLDTFDWPQRAAYQALIRQSHRSRVLVTIHMGDFYGAFRMIAALAEPGREAISLRRERVDEQAMQHFSADRIKHTLLYHGGHQPAGIVSALRKGGHTLAILFDLKEDFGETITVDFFGLPARFVKGPAQLAIMGRAPIVPFVCYEKQGRNHIDMAPLIETRLYRDESLQQGTARLTQQLVRLAERWIRRRPEQWKYLSILPGYFTVPPVEPPAPTEIATQVA